MIKNLIVFIVAIIILILSIGSYLFKMSEEKTLTSEDVKVAISQAQYCDTKEDCVEISAKCPFGCYVFVNKAEQQKVQGIIDSYEGLECLYSCPVINGYDCLEGKCSVIF